MLALSAALATLKASNTGMVDVENHVTLEAKKQMRPTYHSF